MADTSRVIYREYTEEDYSAVEEMVLNLVAEIKVDYDEDSVKRNLQRLFSMPQFVCFIAEENYWPVGCAGFIVTPEIWNDNNVNASEMFWYVFPEYRGGVGGGLINYIEKNINCDSIEFGISDIRLQRMMERKGYKPVKAIIKKGL